MVHSPTHHVWLPENARNVYTETTRNLTLTYSVSGFQWMDNLPETRRAGPSSIAGSRGMFPPQSWSELYAIRKLVSSGKHTKNTIGKPLGKPLENIGKPMGKWKLNGMQLGDGDDDFASGKCWPKTMKRSTMLFMGKITISTRPFSTAMFT